MLTGPLDIRLLWSPVELLLGLSARCFWFLERPLLGQEEGFLVREGELFFLGVTAGFFSLTIFTVGCSDAVEVSGFLAVVEGTCVVWKPASDGTEWTLYMGVVRGLTRGVVWGLVKG